MSLPKASTTELDGALGIRPPASGLPMVFIGQCVAGPLNTPASFARAKDVVANFVGGRAAEAAAYAAEQFGRPVIVVRTDTNTAAAFSALDTSDFAGTSVPTLDTAVTPNDDFEGRLRFIAGGTIGTAGITYQWSLDGGRTWSPVTALGTANEIVFPSSGGLNIDFAAGTVVAGDELSFRATAENHDSTDLDAALLAVTNTALLWEGAYITGPLTAGLAATVSAWLTSMHNAGKHHWAACEFRVPTIGETEAAYLTAFNTAFSAFGDTSMAIGAGAAKVSSAVSRRTYMRPSMFPVAALVSSVSEEIDVAEIDLGRLPNVTLRDSNGNPEAGYHDEAVNPGLDDARALVLRTWDGETGVYTNNPRMASPVGSDFDFIQKRRVMNLARTIVNEYFRRRLSKRLIVNPKTGFVAEAELLAMEAAVNQRLEDRLRKKPKCSSVRVVLSRTDPVLTPPYPLTGQLRLQPLAYPKEIVIESAWTVTQPTT